MILKSPVPGLSSDSEGICLIVFFSNENLLQRFIQFSQNWLRTSPSCFAKVCSEMMLIVGAIGRRIIRFYKKSVVFSLAISIAIPAYLSR